jgi:hypothetical protein
MWCLLGWVIGLSRLLFQSPCQIQVVESCQGFYKRLSHRAWIVLLCCFVPGSGWLKWLQLLEALQETVPRGIARIGVGVVGAIVVSYLLRSLFSTALFILVSTKISSWLCFDWYLLCNCFMWQINHVIHIIVLFGWRREFLWFFVLTTESLVIMSWICCSTDMKRKF